MKIGRNLHVDELRGEREKERERKRERLGGEAVCVCRGGCDETALKEATVLISSEGCLLSSPDSPPHPTRSHFKR